MPTVTDSPKRTVQFTVGIPFGGAVERLSEPSTPARASASVTIRRSTVFREPE